jgi:hypothetical protein
MRLKRIKPKKLMKLKIGDTVRFYSGKDHLHTNVKINKSKKWRITRVQKCAEMGKHCPPECPGTLCLGGYSAQCFGYGDLRGRFEMIIYKLDSKGREFRP